VIFAPGRFGRVNERVLPFVFVLLNGCTKSVQPNVPQPTLDEADLRARVTRRAGSYVASNANAGIVVGVRVHDRSIVLGFGRTRDAIAKSPDGETLFEIGSITKAVTGVLLADAIGRKEMRLDDPVEAYLPGTKIPSFEGKIPITLLHLATNGSGLPMMPTNWVRVDEGPYTPAMFDAFLEGYTLPWAPGTRTMYSNVGFGLLGNAIATKTKSTFGPIVETRVLDLLDMKSTAILGRRRGTGIFAEGHDDDWKAVPDRWDQPRLPACCALESTANDLLKLVTASLRPSSTALGEAILVSQKPRVNAVVELEGQALGLGWFGDIPTDVVWKGGSMKGYRSTIAIDRGVDAGVVVLSNGATIDADGLAFGVLREVHRMNEDRADAVVDAIPFKATRVQIDFGTSIRLLGFVAPERAHVGETIAIEYFYEVRAKIGRDYRVFVHGDALEGKARIHADHYPAMATDRWPVSKIVRDSFTMKIPNDWKPGAFVVWTGIYEGARRLEVVHGEFDDGKNRVRGPTIEVI